MRVAIGRAAPLAAAVTLHRALEAAVAADQDEPPALTRAQRRIVRPRFHALVAATVALAPKVAAAIAMARAAFSAIAGLREAEVRERWSLHEADADELGELEDAIDAMTPDALEQALQSAYASMVGKGIFDVRAEVGIDFDLEPKRAIAALNAYALEFAADVIDDEKTALKRLIAHALKDGTDTQELARLIAIHFADGVHRIDASGNERTVDLNSWSQTVARTETARAYNAGSMAGYHAAEIDFVIWVTADDERVCPVCRAVDRKVVALGELFPVVEKTAPPAHIQCRCVTVALTSATQSMVPPENLPDGWEDAA